MGLTFDDNVYIMGAYKATTKETTQHNEYSLHHSLDCNRLRSRFGQRRLVSNRRDNQQHAKGNTMDITTIAMLAAILIPLAMIGVGDARRHPWGK